MLILFAYSFQILWVTTQFSLKSQFKLDTYLFQYKVSHIVLVFYIIGDFNKSIVSARAAIRLWLKQQKFIFSQFWRIEVQDQGVGSVGSFWGPWEEGMFPPSLLGLWMAIFFCLYIVFPLSSYPNFLFLGGYQSYCIRSQHNDFILI